MKCHEKLSGINVELTTGSYALGAISIHGLFLFFFVEL
jgi:hypothetical protein